jgi:thioredoxin-like negative regulator of GroEL
MNAAAERAYKQALYLWPGNTETTSNLVNLYTRLGRFKDAHDLVVGYLPLDPNSKILQRLSSVTETRMKAAEQLPAQMAALQASPDNRQAMAALLQGLLILGKTQEIDTIVSNAVSRTPGDFNFLRDMINFYATQGRIPQALEIARMLAKSQPDQWDIPYTIAKYELLSGHREECLSNVSLAVKLGGKAALQQIANEQLFQQIAKDPAFQRALEGGIPTKESAANSLLESIQQAISKQKETSGPTNRPTHRNVR